MASDLPPWHLDPDHPSHIIVGLSMRNDLLYGAVRGSDAWTRCVTPPADWKFSSDPELNGMLIELWTLFAETHFVHFVLALVDSEEPDLVRLREIQDGYREETAAHIAEDLYQLRQFAHRYPAARILVDLFDIDWDNWWVVEAGDDGSHVTYDDFAAMKAAVSAEAYYEVRYGTLGSISADDIHLDMIVVDVSGEFDFEISIMVVDFNCDTQVALCQDHGTSTTKAIPLASLRDPNAIGSEIVRRLQTARDATASSPKIVMLVRRPEQPSF